LTLNSLHALAKHLGRAKSGLHKAYRLGRISPEPDGTWNPERVLEDLEANRVKVDVLRDTQRAPAARQKGDQRHGEGSDRSAAVTYSDARAVTELHRAEILKLELARRRQELVDRREVERAAYDVASEWREALEHFLGRLPHELAAEFGLDVTDVTLFTEERCREFLAEHAEAVERKIPVDASPKREGA